MVFFVGCGAHGWVVVCGCMERKRLVWGVLHAFIYWCAHFCEHTHACHYILACICTHTHTHTITYPHNHIPTTPHTTKITHTHTYPQNHSESPSSAAGGIRAWHTPRTTPTPTSSNRRGVHVEDKGASVVRAEFEARIERLSKQLQVCRCGCGCGWVWVWVGDWVWVRT